MIVKETTLKKTWHGLPTPIRGAFHALESRLGSRPRFVIVSTARAGSTYIAKLLTEAGIPCAHEGFFTPSGFHRRFFYRGDSSFVAVPYLENNPGLTTGPILHQVRHPLDVINSLSGIGFFEFSKTKSPFRRFVRAHFSLTGDILIDYMRWWVEWNLRCQALACKTIRLEDIGERQAPEAAAEHLEDVFKILAQRPKDNWKVVAESLRGQKVNSRVRNNLTLDVFPDGRAKRELIELGREYGYNL